MPDLFPGSTVDQSQDAGHVRRDEYSDPCQCQFYVPPGCSELAEQSPISLEPNSLYIATFQLPDTPGQGFFHWSLYLTDSFGKATKYHWVEQPKRLVRITGYAEDVAFGPMDPFNSFSDNMTMRVGLFKIDGVAPVEPTVMYQLAMNAFNTRGYPTVEGNRRHGLSCCTWVRQVLIKLYQRGYIQRNERFSSRKIENAVRDRSLQLEQDLARGQLVQPGVMTI